ncbi:hypothetical protein CALCODRAFT_209305 [Calocera cornea HHB12733]|uniref:Uncharacterized protein n=1 Tax=Calocera cornea HHB12733 TaxID=1353952 RepID=A0A165HD92_9BASI|nr:hypothetical protein CALCODRAFT_209305 [Calocera cornea HHB12733]
MGQGDMHESFDFPPSSQLHRSGARPADAFLPRMSKPGEPRAIRQSDAETSNTSTQRKRSNPEHRFGDGRRAAERFHHAHIPSLSDPPNPRDANRDAHRLPALENGLHMPRVGQNRSGQPGDNGHSMARRHSDPSQHLPSQSPAYLPPGDLPHTPIMASRQLFRPTGPEVLPNIVPQDVADSNSAMSDPDILSLLLQATRSAKQREQELRELVSGSFSNAALSDGYYKNTRVTTVQEERDELQKKLDRSTHQMTQMKSKASEQMKKSQELFNGFKAEMDKWQEGGKKLVTAVTGIQAFVPQIQDLRKQVKAGVEAISPLIGMSEMGLAKQHVKTRETMDELIKEKENAERDYQQARQTIDLLRGQMEHSSCELAEAKEQIARLERRQEEDKASLQVAQEAKTLYEQMKKQDFQAREKQNSEVIDCIIKAAELEVQNEKLKEEIKRQFKAEQLAVEDLKGALNGREQHIEDLKKDMTKQHALIATYELQLKQLAEHWKDECESLRAREEKERQERFKVVVENEKQAFQLVSQREVYEEKISSVQVQYEKATHDIAALQERYETCRAQQLRSDDIIRQLKDSVAESDAGATAEKTLLDEKIFEMEAENQRLKSELATSQRKLEDLQKNERQRSKDMTRYTGLEKDLNKYKQQLENEQQIAKEEKRRQNEALIAVQTERDQLRGQMASAIERYRTTALTEDELKFVQVINDEMQKVYNVDQVRARNEIKRLQSENVKLQERVELLEAKYREQLAKIIPSQSSASATPASHSVLNDPVPGELHEVSSRGRPARQYTAMGNLFEPTSPMSTEDDDDRRPPVSTVNPMDTVVQPSNKKRARQEDQDGDYVPPKARRATARAPSVVPSSKAKTTYRKRR